MNKNLNNAYCTDSLLKWYNSNSYNFPWRDCANPYKIWVSEIMLQQTQIKTVIPYFNNWINEFPNINAVANTDINNILKQWEGLGYYARARNFYQSCKIIKNIYKGKIPTDYSHFLKLPGVGPYIAGAVFSIAFKVPIPAIDTNVHRVISRLYEIDGVFNKSKNKIHDILTNIISKQFPGDFNQAIMDLGREICTSKNPKCEICPIINYCKSYINKSTNKYPSQIKIKNKPHYKIGVGIIWNKGNILITRRKEKGLLGGLWEFPGGKIKTGESIKQCIVREIQEELDIYVHPTAFLKRIKHNYSHFSITMDAYNCNYLNGYPKAIGCDKWRWIKPENIKNFPFPKANHKLFDKIIPDIKNVKI